MKCMAEGKPSKEMAKSNARLMPGSESFSRGIKREDLDHADT